MKKITFAFSILSILVLSGCQKSTLFDPPCLRYETEVTIANGCGEGFYYDIDSFTVLFVNIDRSAVDLSNACKRFDISQKPTGVTAWITKYRTWVPLECRGYCTGMVCSQTFPTPEQWNVEKGLIYAASNKSNPIEKDCIGYTNSYKLEGFECTDSFTAKTIYLPKLVFKNVPTGFCFL